MGLDPDRIEMDVPREDGKIVVLVYQDAGIATLIQVANPLVPAVKIAGVGDIEIAHEFGKIAEWCFEEEMEVVGHEDVTTELNAVDINRLIQNPQEALAVGVVFVDVFTLVATAGDVVDGAFVLDAQGARHNGNMAKPELLVNNKDLTPIVRCCSG